MPKTLESNHCRKCGKAMYRDSTRWRCRPCRSAYANCRNAKLKNAAPEDRGGLTEDEYEDSLEIHHAEYMAEAAKIIEKRFAVVVIPVRTPLGLTDRTRPWWEQSLMGAMAG